MPTGAATTTKLRPRGAYQTRAPPWRSSARTGVALRASARSAAPHAPAKTLLTASPYAVTARIQAGADGARSEEHTSELQSRVNLVCRLLLEKKKAQKTRETNRTNMTRTI